MKLSRRPEKGPMAGAAEALAYAAIDRRAEAAALAAAAEGLGWSGGPFADLGCGPGDLAEALLLRRPGARAACVDLSDIMLSLAEARLRAGGLRRRAAFYRADVRRTGLPGGGFALVTCCNAAHHLASPVPLLLEMRRLCRPGGLLLLRDLRRPASEAGLRRLLAAAAGDTPAQLALLEASYRAAFTAEEATAAAAAAGLEGARAADDGARHWRLAFRPQVF